MKKTNKVLSRTECDILPFFFREFYWCRPNFAGGVSHRMSVGVVDGYMQLYFKSIVTIFPLTTVCYSHLLLTTIMYLPQPPSFPSLNYTVAAMCRCCREQEFEKCYCLIPLLLLNLISFEFFCWFFCLFSKVDVDLAAMYGSNAKCLEMIYS